MKTVPLKRSLDVDLKEAISSFAIRHYGREQVESLSSSLESIQKCRKDVVAALNNSSNPLDQTLRALRLWLSYILILEERLPFDNVNGVEIQFSWTCTFTPKIYTTFSSIHFEKLCVLFNIAAIYSCLAYASDRSSDEGVKEAVKQFKAAASVFSLLKAQLAPSAVGKSTPELSEAGLSMHIALMSAQAQSGIYEKAVKDKLNRSLLSKLATQVANLYSSASSFSHSLTQLPPSLIAWFEIQHLAFLSAGHYQRSLFELVEVERRSEGYGSVVARLRCAVDKCRKAIEKADATGVTVDLTVLLEASEKSLKALEADNKMVYIEAVPPESSLPPLEGVCAVISNSPLSIEELCIDLPGVKELYDNIVPLKVRRAIEEFDSRCAVLINEASEKTSSLSCEIDAFCSDHGLPFIVSEEPQTSMPDNLWKKIEDAQVRGGVAAAEGLLLAVESGAESCGNSLESLEHRLLQEERTDKQYGAAYGEVWKRLPSRQLTELYWESIRKYKLKLNLAIRANQIIKESLSEAIEWKKTFMQSRELIESSLPQDFVIQNENDSSRQTKREVRFVLDSLFSSMLAVKLELDEVKSVTKDAAHSRLMASAVRVVNSEIPIHVLVDKEVEAITNRLHLVDLQRDKCRTLFDAAVAVWKNQETKIVTFQSRERLTALKSLDAAATAVCRAHHDGQDGLAFFNTLSQYITSLTLQIDDFLLARREEAFDILNTVGPYNNRSTYTPPSYSYTQPSQYVPAQYAQPQYAQPQYPQPQYAPRPPPFNPLFQSSAEYPSWPHISGRDIIPINSYSSSIGSNNSTASTHRGCTYDHHHPNNAQSTDKQASKSVSLARL